MSGLAQRERKSRIAFVLKYNLHLFFKFKLLPASVEPDRNAQEQRAVEYVQFSEADARV